ncbi:hypothetical protein [Pseudoalteromonas prydzensis]|uniref:hypothetical protein n=1 Tax=Pseudoalteromonas prydzensis TaxID=182141 RepID=UPI0007E4F875|nr:hypothetical protein [Pseudoalteromonas prydzensis]MBE0378503.1 hypothetical protein [Pseudoalteromonas prydzensis ACAM 620]
MSSKLLLGLILLLIPISLIVGVFISYFGVGPAKSLADWGATGDFFGGLLNPLLTFCSILILIYSLRLQQKAGLEAAISAEKTAKINLEQLELNKAAQELQFSESEKQRLHSEKLIKVGLEQNKHLETQIKSSLRSAKETHILNQLDNLSRSLNTCLSLEVDNKERKMSQINKATLVWFTSDEEDSSITYLIKMNANRIEQIVIGKLSLITFYLEELESVENFLGRYHFEFVINEVEHLVRTHGYFIRKNRDNILEKYLTDFYNFLTAYSSDSELIKKVSVLLNLLKKENDPKSIENYIEEASCWF